METTERLKALRNYGNIDRVPVRNPDDPPFRYALTVALTPSKDEWWAQSGHTLDEAIWNLYDCFSGELWKHCLNLDSPTT